MAKIKDIKAREILDSRGNPTIDIKPYWPQYDKPEKTKIPDWGI